MATAETEAASTARVNTDTARIDRLPVVQLSICSLAWPAGLTV